ncbi:MAG: hypothetical protein RIS70_900 [Planctomycetota bacterium]|jgi:4-hydroxybenzoate polyprenyltransferase
MESPPQSSKLLAYLKLCRLPNVFTALADIGMGACYVRGASPPDGSMIALLLASGMMYTAGMVLNDVYDIEIDRRERPQRPLPSGLIHLDWARKLGFGLLVLGVLFAWASPWLSGVNPTGMQLWRSGVIGVLLAGAILGYDIVLKHTPIGPIAMGSCRFLNVLLGMSISIDASTNLAVFAGFSPAQFVVAGGIGVYIVGVTFFAKSEATTSQAFLLFASLLVVVAGMALLALFPRMGVSRPLAIAQPGWWPAIMAILGLFVIRPAMRAIMKPQSRYVQAAVKHFIVSLITLDAAVTFAMAGSVPAFMVLGLLVPMLIMGKWVYST